jgi:hypothetical protein
MLAHTQALTDLDLSENYIADAAVEGLATAILGNRLRLTSLKASFYVWWSF